MNMRKTMGTLKTLLAAAVAVATVGKATAASVTVVDVANGNPRSTITVIYTLDNMDADPDCKVAFDITANGVKKGVTNEAAKLTSGTYAKTIDTAALFGAARTDPKAKVSVSLIAAKSVEPQPVGVQLWENGPYWAECNVGASKPEEYGYYFWWGDTVGYKRNAANNGWVSVKDGSSFYFWKTTCPTYGKSISDLQTEGYVDSTGNLLAAHDAATAHLGAPWRMPTKAEMDALINNCTSAWITTNGVSGRMFAGKGTYASKSIFIPAAGLGNYFDEIERTGSSGYYWSSTPDSKYSDVEWYLIVPSDYFRLFSSNRYYGCSVRPVRGFAQ